MWKRLLWLLPALFTLAYFLHYAWWGLYADFTHDDLMNMWRSLARSYPDLVRDNLSFWRFTPTYRPLGALVYKLSLDLAGLDIQPLRIFCYAVLCLNMFLVYCLGRRLTGSREVGVLAALLHSYHSNFAGLYLSTGTLYDILCFTFTVSALLVYERMRRTSGGLAIMLSVAVCLLMALALDSKEMALALPLVLSAYELIYVVPTKFERGAIGRWLLRGAPVPLATAAMAAAFYFGRVAGPEGIEQSGGDYRPALGLAEYLKQTGHYLGELFYQPGGFSAGKTVVFLLILFAAAWLMRSRALWFSAAFFTLGILPMAFIPPRGLHAVYLPLAGLAVFLAAALVQVRDLLLDVAKRRVGYRSGGRDVWNGFTPARIVLFLLVASQLLHFHSGMSGFYEAWQKEYGPIRAVVDQMPRLHPSLPSGARILMVRDPFGESNWSSQFIACLVYREPHLSFDRLASMDKKPTAEEIASYTIRLDWEDGKLRDLSPAEVPREP